MSGKRAKAARRLANATASDPAPATQSFWRTPKGIAVVLAGIALVAASFVTPRLVGSDGAQAPAAHAMGADEGTGLAAGAPVPRFIERDVVTGRAITSASIRQRKTLLFFSEGVMCQACFEQIKGLEQMGDELERRGIRLVSITPDSAADLEQAIGQYGITTPMIADADSDMSRAFNTLGKGMHEDTPGHAFVLVAGGKVLWQRDYWLDPYRTMYVEPAQVLADLPGA